MLASTSILSQCLIRLFGTTGGISPPWRAGQRRRAKRRYACAAEVMESRELLSASFGGVVSLGSPDGSCIANDVATDASGDRYVIGTFSGTVDFDAAADSTYNLVAQGNYDAYVAKYEADGTFAWAQRMGGDATIVSGSVTNSLSTDSGVQITLDGSGNVYIVGTFTGSADFGSAAPLSASAAGDRDAFVAKLNASDGVFQWAKSWGTTGPDLAEGVGVDSAGNVYTSGLHAGAPNYYTLTYDSDIIKFNSSGIKVWSRSIATRSGTPSGGLAVDSSGNTFVAGSFLGTVDFDPGNKTNNVSSGSSYSAYSGFVLKLTTAGNYSWVSPFVSQTVGSTSGLSYVNSVALDGSGNVVVGGQYHNSVDFDSGRGTTTLPTIGGGFISKLNSKGGLVWARALESSSTTFVNDLAVGTDGSIYATGTFFGTVDLDPSAGSYTRTTAGSGDAYVLKLTSAGGFSWAETFGGTGYDGGAGISLDSTGAVNIVGAYSGPIDFDPDPLNVFNLDTHGTFLLRMLQV
ncbi:MAG: hypothetical protein KDB01_17400 [Planctomycetaceae bacterium]|nr:hypothetical protein [Planctomycetaceae bacterium]